ncbi:hypothetical protein VPNG_07111 [Cytospora leucostoma]|uniref:2EXR domain-containing protein n=1 Tax=Cytospora leucostoma TaxID=1230097 RepID=A0A423WVK2_9PEZI|nr:hypothetical protein VPNG_07111 [Cytospora leucostoma]
MAEQTAKLAVEIGLGRLPIELRLRVWEETWPATRLIEVTLPPGPGVAPQRTKPSRQVGDERITAWDSVSTRLEDVSCRPYSMPVALQVCRESRDHTLKTYRRLQHSHVPDCCFYFDPRRDILWLHRDLSQFDMSSLGLVQRVLFKDVERYEDSGADKKQRRRELLEMIESMGCVRDVMVLVHWTSIADLDDRTEGIETLYDWMQYYMYMLDENWEMLDGHEWTLQFLSTWDEFGVCFQGSETRLWGNAREGPPYGCPSHDVVYRKRLVERFPNKFMENMAVPPSLSPSLAEDGSYYDLGTYRRPVTTHSSEAQIWFDRGLVWSYGFNHEESAACFQRAIELDPEFAMAYWGLAYALGPNYNKPWDFFEGRERETTVERTHRAVKRAGELSAKVSPVEGAIIEALKYRYPRSQLTDDEANDPEEWKRVWNKEYADAMGTTYKAFPDDLDVATLYVDALMNLTPWKLWDLRTGEPAPGAYTLEAKQALERAFAQPGGDTHPGLLHLWIHLIEMSSHPEDGLAKAENLRKLVPDSGHLNHMPSHLDILCGLYKDSVVANSNAIRADETYLARAGPMNFYTLYRSHNYHFLIYGAMFSGQSRIALETAAQLEATLPESLLRVESPPMADWLEAFVPLRIHILIRFGRWHDIIATPLPEDRNLYSATTATLHYAKGVALAALGRVEEADEERVKFRRAHESVPKSRTLFNNAVVDILGVASAMLDGEIEYRRGNFDQAFEHLRTAIDRDDNLPYDEPWGWMQPTRHAYSALLLEQGRVEDALAVYKADLGVDDTLPRAQQHRNNVWSLHGYHECLVKLGRHDEARQVEPRLNAALEVADVPIKASCFCRLHI